MVRSLTLHGCSTCPLTIGVGLGLALILNQRVRVVGFYRTGISSPSWRRRRRQALLDFRLRSPVRHANGLSDGTGFTGRPSWRTPTRRSSCSSRRDLGGGRVRRRRLPGGAPGRAAGDRRGGARGRRKPLGRLPVRRPCRLCVRSPCSLAVWQTIAALQLFDGLVHHPWRSRRRQHRHPRLLPTRWPSRRQVGFGAAISWACSSCRRPRLSMVTRRSSKSMSSEATLAYRDGLSTSRCQPTGGGGAAAAAERLAPVLVPIAICSCSRSCRCCSRR